MAGTDESNSSQTIINEALKDEDEIVPSRPL